MGAKVTVRRVSARKLGAEGSEAYSVNVGGRIIGHVYRPLPGHLGAGRWGWSSKRDDDHMVTMPLVCSKHAAISAVKRDYRRWQADRARFGTSGIVPCGFDRAK